ncbi:E3 ubiquitin-protein ligase RFWD3-like isoform X2 [Pocillopora verrucosa]
MARAQAERAGNMEDGEDDASLCTCQAVNQCVGGPTQKLPRKSRLFTCPDDCNTLMAATGDESRSLTLIWMAAMETSCRNYPSKEKRS